MTKDDSYGLFMDAARKALKDNGAFNVVAGLSHLFQEVDDMEGEEAKNYLFAGQIMEAVSGAVDLGHSHECSVTGNLDRRNKLSELMIDIADIEAKK